MCCEIVRHLFDHLNCRQVLEKLETLEDVADTPMRRAVLLEQVA